MFFHLNPVPEEGAKQRVLVLRSQEGGGGGGGARFFHFKVVVDCEKRSTLSFLFKLLSGAKIVNMRTLCRRVRRLLVNRCLPDKEPRLFLQIAISIQKNALVFPP